MKIKVLSTRRKDELLRLLRSRKAAEEEIQLYKPFDVVSRCRPMAILKKYLLLLFVPALMIGCATPNITNLTPSRLPRKDNGQYPFETQLNSRQQSLIKESVKAYVIVGLDQYPMQRVPMLTNRWETLVPIPSDQNVVTYRFKFDYDYRGIPTHQSDSKVSKHYQLYILDK